MSAIKYFGKFLDVNSITFKGKWKIDKQRNRKFKM